MYMGIEDKNFELLLKAKQHKEIVAKLDAILQKLLSNDTTLDTTGLEEAIKGMTLKQELESIPKSILALSDLVVSKLQELKKEKSEWVFDVKRDNNGYIETVLAKEK